MYKRIYKNMQLLTLFTLIISIILILLVCYTNFNARLKSEIKNETLILADIVNEETDTAEVLQRLEKRSYDKRITLVSESGEVLYDNDVYAGELDNHSGRPEIDAALKSGFGEAQRRSETLGKNVYYYAVRLNSGEVLRAAGQIQDVYRMFLSISIPVLAIAVFIYIITIFIAKNLTENITRPINDINLTGEEWDNVYDELIPLLKRIQGQNAEIKRQMEKVKRQKIRLQAIGENMNEGLIVLDKNGLIISANDSALEIFNAAGRDVIHQSFLHLTRDMEMEAHLEKAFEGNKDTFTTLINQKAYQIFYSPVFENSAVSGIVMLVFDISAKAEAEQIRREFSANVSHELKTPLTTILGYSQIINNDIAKPEDIRGFMMKIEKEASRLLALIDDIIELSRLDEQSDEMRMCKIDLLDIVNEVAEQLSEKAAQKNVTISVSGSNTVIEGNPHQITELVYNICDNAIKYNRDGGSVSIALGDKQLSISDTGIGIPAEYLDRIFERFFRVDKSRSKKVNGTGLGLSIVKHIAMRHKAEINVKSVPNEGTCFTVSFKN